MPQVVVVVSELLILNDPTLRPCRPEHGEGAFQVPLQLFDGVGFNRVPGAGVVAKVWGLVQFAMVRPRFRPSSARDEQRRQQQETMERDRSRPPPAH